MARMENGECARGCACLRVCVRLDKEPTADIRDQHESSKRMEMSTTKEHGWRMARGRRERRQNGWNVHVGGLSYGGSGTQRNGGNNFSNKLLFMNNSIFVHAQVRHCFCVRDKWWRVLCACAAAVHGWKWMWERERDYFFNSFSLYDVNTVARFNLTLFSRGLPFPLSPPRARRQSFRFENNSRYKYLMKKIRKGGKIASSAALTTVAMLSMTATKLALVSFPSTKQNTEFLPPP